MQSVQRVLGRTKLFANNYRSFAAATTFKHADLSIEEAKIRKIKPTTLNGQPFGKIFTDHMFVCDWTKEEGWAAP